MEEQEEGAGFTLKDTSFLWVYFLDAHQALWQAD